MVKPVTPADVVWTYSGVRPLFDDGDDNPSAVTRDYHLEVDGARRATAPAALGVRRQDHDLPAAGRARAARISRPTIPHMGVRLDRRRGRWPTASWPTRRPSRRRSTRFVDGAASVKPGLPKELVRVLARRHGSGLDDLLEDVKTVADLGRHFGGHLYEVEVRYLMRDEWAVEAEDVLWRRTKEGLHMTEAERDGLRALDGRAAAQLYIT